MKLLAPTVREHARNRGKLDGADAQALEHALTQAERERDEGRQQLERGEQTLDAQDEILTAKYNEQLARASQAERERDEARRELVKSRFGANAAAFEALDAVYAIIAAVNDEQDPRTNMQIDEMRDEGSHP